MPESARRRRILFLAPFPPRLDGHHGGSRAMAHTIASLAPRADIALLCLRSSADPPVDDLLRQRCGWVEEVPFTPSPSVVARARRLGALVLGTPRWVTVCDVERFASRARALAAWWMPEVVHLEYHVMGQYAQRLGACAAPRVLTEYEPGATAAREYAAGRPGVRGVLAALEARAWERYERRVLAQVQTVVAFTERDRQALAALVPGATVTTITPGIALPEQPARAASSADAERVLFTGNFAHAPNRDAALWLAREIFPRVRATCPTASLQIVGSQAGSLPRHAGGAGVTVAGPVPDLGPWVDAAAVVVAPVRQGGGVRVKVMEALAAGKAVVATPRAIEGLDVTADTHLRVAESADAIADAIVGLLRAPAERTALGSRAREWASMRLGFDRPAEALARLHAQLADAAAEPDAERAVLPVSVVICTRNRSAMVRRALLEIWQGAALPAEVVIVDQSDVANVALETITPPPRCTLRYAWEPGHGASRASNRGVALAHHEIVAFTHDDTLPDRRWLERLVAALDAADARSVVTGRVISTEPERPGAFAPTLSRETRPVVYQGRLGVDVLKPLNFAVRRGVFLELGGFDPRLGPGTDFPGAEDSDLGFRMLDAGLRVIYVPDAVVRHRAWRASGEYLALRYRYGVAQGAFYAKHLRRGDLFMAGRMARDALRRMARFPARLWHERSRAFGDPLFIAGNIAGAARWLARRGTWPSSGVAADDAGDAGEASDTDRRG